MNNKEIYTNLFAKIPKDVQNKISVHIHVKDDFCKYPNSEPRMEKNNQLAIFYFPYSNDQLSTKIFSQESMGDMQDLYLLALSVLEGIDFKKLDKGLPY